MRPYSGIGVLQISQYDSTEPLALFDEPGISRCCAIAPSEANSIYPGLFCQGAPPHLIVTAMRSDWAKVEYDDAGREAWINLRQRWIYNSWPDFLKGREVVFLKNSPKRHMQLMPKPTADSGHPIQSGDPIRVVLVKEDQAYVFDRQLRSGWIRWKDQDSRLLISIACMEGTAQNR